MEQIISILDRISEIFLSSGEYSPATAVAAIIMFVVRYIIEHEFNKEVRHPRSG